PPALVMSALPPGGPLVRSAFPRMPQGTGAAGHGPSGAGAFNIIVPVRTQGAPAEPSHTQTTVLAQAPLNWSAPGALCGGAQCPAPLLLATPAVGTVMPAASIGGTWAGEGYWFPGQPLPAPLPAAQLGPTVVPGNDGPRPHGAGGEGGKAPSQAKAAPEDSCNPRSVYDNFRRWQRFKSLARGHLPQSPDAEALSCFLIPVLRSLARLKPTMSLEDGVRRAMQEWQGTSNYDRMNYYDMAAKFMEFEAEEEMQLRVLQCVKGPQGLPPPAPPKLAPPGQQLTQAKAPKEIPPEAVQEYVDIMEALLGPHANWEDEDIEEQQEQDGTDPDPGLLSYINKLCSQEDFITKVEAIVHPRFLAALLSPDPNLDPLALTEVLEQEEGLTLAQLVEKRLAAPNDAGAFTYYDVVSSDSGDS
ncbi:NUT family member 2G-like, partial [Cynocephalus volans]|uniref:NUT family member 2G-like n=1 Tax=Cynocephalus volans TaxID=110931 RepID=UPI002FCA98B5